MKIESLYIEDMWNLKQLNVTFEEPETAYFDRLKISVLVGENGTGKTSLLKFLSAVFFYPHVYTRELSKGFELQYSIGGQIYSIDASSFFSNREWEAPSKVIVSTHSLFEAFMRKQPDRNSKVEYVNVSPVNKSGKSSLSAVSLPILEAFYGSDLLNMKSGRAVRSLLELIGYTEPPAVEVQINGKGLSTEKAKRLNEYHELVGKRVDQADSNTRRILPQDLNSRWFQDVMDISKTETDLVQALWFQKNGEWIRMSQMSSGELTMFNRFFPLIQAMTDHSLVLIDEPETHLHPRWIQQYVHILSELFGSYESHILLATHSPLIASDVPVKCIVGLLTTEEGRIETYEVQNATLGGNAAEILHAVFRVEEAQGRFSMETMQRIQDDAEQGRLENAMAMYRDLSTSSEKFALFRAIKPYLEQE